MKNHGGVQLAEAVKRAYDNGQTDYSLEPLVLEDQDGKPVGQIKDNDAVIFCCRRGEREIELTDAFTDQAFDKFDRPLLRDLDFVILTMYHEKFKHLPIAFAPSKVKMPLAEVISRAGKTQLHCSESEKFAHVTFFLNGGENKPFPGEDDFCIPSPKGIAFDQQPELSLPAVADKVIDSLGKYDFIVTNIANGDVIGHTANCEAKIAAAGYVDRHLDRIVNAAKEQGYVVAITADHGNLETMLTPEGKPHVAHTTNLVPFIVIDPASKQAVTSHDGSLGDVAPTVLKMLGVAQPAEMEGTPLTAHDFGKDRKVLLIILDGWGFGAKDNTDPIYLGETPHWDALIETYTTAKLHASGEYVGLGAGKAGNSEAGHTNIGAGRVVAQDDVRLDRAMTDGSFQKNEVFLGTMERVKARGGNLHLLALLTKKSSHGAIDYPLALLEMAREKGLENVYVHVIFDGRSTEPGSAPQLLTEVDGMIDAIGVGEIVGGVGRGIALDRDGNFAKVQKAYDSMVNGKGARYR